MKRTLAFLGSTALGLLFSAFLFSQPALATTSDCKTVTSHLVNRPDNGNHGVWADDSLTRTVKVCVVPTPELKADAVQVNTWKYHAEVTDEGTFVTKAGAHLSPEHGVALVGGVNGKMSGHFTADFTAAHDWAYWNGAAFDGKTFTGAPGGANPTTSDWVKALWTDGFKGSSINKDWWWKYGTCNELWRESAEGDQGDITGASRLIACVTATFVDTCTGTTVKVKTSLANDKLVTVVRLNTETPTKLTGNTEQTTNVPSSTPTVQVQHWLGKWVEVATHTWKLPASCVSVSPPTVPAQLPTNPTLPVTGAKIPVIAGTGLAAVGAGGLLLFLVLRHRRKVEFVSE